jgi:hydrophobe/amphiphile efflux-1 (HAE1) family protein
MNLSEVSIRKPVFAWMLMFGLMLFGYLNFRQMGVSQLPDVDFPNVSISVTLSGAAPEVIEMTVIEPIESGLTAVAGIKEISSSASPGRASVNVEFDIDKNIDVAVQEIQAKLGQIQRQLPKDADSPIIRKSNPEDQPIMWVAVNSDRMSRPELMRYVRDQVRDIFQTLPGVADVFLGGYVDPVLRVDVSTSKLNSYDLTVSDVVNTIQNEHVELPSGRLEQTEKEINLRTLGEATDVESFANLPISRRGGSINYAPIPLKNVAVITDGLDDTRRISRVMGKAAVGLGVRKQRGVNAVEVARGVKDKIQALKTSLPEGMDISVNFDSTKFIEESIEELNFTIILSAILTALVCWIFLGSFTATINVILAIPMSVLGSFIVLKWLDFTLNTFTLLGLSLAIGIVVDDTIMVLENIYRHSEMGKKRKRAALDGALEIFFAALAATAAIIAIFLPVAFMEGLIGRYFYQFGVTISVAVAISLVEAMTLTPMRCSRFLASTERTTWFGRAVEGAFKWCEHSYRALIPHLLKFRWAVIIASIVIFSASLMIHKHLRKEFTPSQDQGSLMVRVRGPVGASLEYTNIRMKQMEDIIAKQPEVIRYFAAVGGFSGDVSSGMIFVTLQDLRSRTKRPDKGKPLSQEAVAEILRTQFKEVKGIRAFVSETSAGSIGGGRGRPVELSIRGPDWKTLIEASQNLTAEMEKLPELRDVENGYKGVSEELHILPNREKALRHGVGITDIANTVNVLMGGAAVAKFSNADRRYDIKVRQQADERISKENILAVRVRNNRGELIRLSDLVTIQTAESMQTISRRDRERAISVSSNLKSGANQEAAIRQVSELAAKILPVGYRAVPSGNSETFKETFQSLIFAILMGLVIAYMVLASQFNSFVDPFTVLIALPFSLTGAFVALYLTNQSINIYSMIGIILLMGIVKKNSILLVDYTNQVRVKTKAAVYGALAEACPVRLRPILMTSFATIAAAVPPALAIGPGAEARIPLAMAIIGGVTVSTVLTLFIVPCVYSLFTTTGELSEAIDD